MAVLFAHLNTRFSLIVGAALVCALIFVAQYVLRILNNPLNKVPGPIYARFTNLPLKAAVISGKRVHHVQALHERYGTLVRISPNEVAVADTAAFKQIHSINSGFQKSPWYNDLVSLGRDAVFNMTDSKIHAARRRLLSRPFSKSHLRQHWEGMVQERARLAVSLIRSEAKSGFTDVLKWWTFMASDVSAHLMFGQSFQTLEHGEISDYIRKLQSALMGGGVGAELPVLRWIGKRIPVQICQDLWAANDYLLNYAKIAVTNMKSTRGSTNIFANMMVEAEKGEQLQDIDVQIEALALIVAGSDTTSVTLTYLVYAVLSNPELQCRLEAEVKSLPENFGNADVEQLVLFNAVVEETLRLYGAAPGGLPRIVPRGGVSMKDMFIPEGITVTTQAFTLHRDAALFPEPLSFIPERWIPSSRSTYRVSDLARSVYCPFGAGARTCLGVHLAYIELRIAGAQFFRECAGARLAPSVSVASMHMENFFLITPIGHKCEITLA